MADLVAAIASVSLDKADDSKAMDDTLVTSVALDNEDEGDGDEEDVQSGVVNGDKKKKKKKKAKKKAGSSVKEAPSAVAETTGTQLPKSRLLTGFTDYYVAYGQTDPPTKTVASLFPNGGFPIGQLEPHGISKCPLPERYSN